MSSTSSSSSTGAVSLAGEGSLLTTISSDSESDWTTFFLPLVAFLGAAGLEAASCGSGDPAVVAPRVVLRVWVEVGGLGLADARRAAGFLTGASSSSSLCASTWASSELSSGVEAATLRAREGRAAGGSAFGTADDARVDLRGGMVWVTGYWNRLAGGWLLLFWTRSQQQAGASEISELTFVAVCDVSGWFQVVGCRHMVGQPNAAVECGRQRLLDARLRLSSKYTKSKRR